MGFNPFDPSSLFGGGSPTDLFGGGSSTSSGDAAAGAGAVGGGLSGLSGEEGQDKANELDVNKAYGFGGGGNSNFNKMRTSQLGMGRQGG